MFLFMKIEEIGVIGHSALSAIADYILEDRERILHKSLQEVADETYTSKASVVRFAKTLGYSGWKEFLKDYMKEWNYQNQFNQEVDFSFPFNADSSAKEIAESLKILAKQTLDDSFEKLDFEAINRIVNLMQRANRIVIFCVSPHVYSAELFQRKMMTIQKPIQVVHAREMGLNARSLTHKDLAILISYSGQNEEAEPMNIVHYLRENHVPVVAITSEGSNYLREQVDTVLTMTTMEALYNKIATFSTEESLQYLLNVLYSCYFARSYEDNRNNKVESARLLETRRAHSDSIHE